MRKRYSGPDPVAPADQTADLFAKLAVDVLQEASELFGVLNPNQGVPMCCHKDHVTAEHAIALLGASEDADHDLVQGRAWP
jgi:hypothetical protein